MNVEQKTIDALNLELTIKMVADDYAPSRKKILKNYKRKAEFKGFRKGMVPDSLIEKVYGEQALVESVNEVVYEALNKHIKDNNLNVLGEPLASETQPEVQWVNGNEFSFVFDVALSPELSFEVESSDEIASYNVSASDEEKNKMIENVKKSYEERAKNTAAAAAAEAAAEEEEEEAAPVKSDEEIASEVEEMLKNRYKNEAEWKLNKDIRNYFVSKSAITLPEAFLKRWLFAVNKDKFTEEQMEKEFPAFLEDFKWQLVRGYLMRKFEFKIEQKDITDAAEDMVRYQYAMYGLSELPAEIVKNAANEILSDRKQIDRLVEQVEDTKVITKIKEIVSLKATEITSTQFNEL